MLLAMIPMRRLLSFSLVSLFALVFSGCGASPMAPVAPTSPAASSQLAGNWLLFGSIPPAVATFPVTVGTSSLLAEFDVVGTKIVAAASIRVACTPQGIVEASFGTALTGTIAPDGTFSVSTPSISGSQPLPSLTIQGTAPSTAGAPWAGSYTFSLTSLSGQGCTVNASGSFTANPIADIDGTFIGSGAMAALSSSVKTPVTLDLTLKQGGLLYSLPGGMPVDSRLALDGSIQVQGISCFSKGTSAVGRPSLIDGSGVDASFTMDDGSTLQVQASLVDSNVTQLALVALYVSGGQCAGNYLALPPLQLQR